MWISLYIHVYRVYLYIYTQDTVYNIFFQSEITSVFLAFPNMWTPETKYVPSKKGQFQKRNIISLPTSNHYFSGEHVSFPGSKYTEEMN